MSSAPKPTDPAITSALQTSSNVGTSIANAYLQNMDETTPDGTKKFTKTGNRRVAIGGQYYSIPTFSVEQTLSDSQQAIKDQNDQASLNLSTLGADLSGTLGEKLTGNFSLGNEETESRLFDLGRKRLDPLFAERDEDLRTRLANQGIKVGSAAYDRELERLEQQENDAYSQLLLQGRGQASQELLTEDNQRINQISALLNGGQVSMPNFMTGANIGAITPTDQAAIIANYDSARANAYGAQQRGIGSAIGGLGGLGGLFLGG